MNVIKFGGSSIATAERMKNTLAIIQEQKAGCVVLSATAGTTNQLERIIALQKTFQKESAEKELSELKKKHLDIIDKLYNSEKTKQYIKQELQYLINKTAIELGLLETRAEEKNILALGEKLSCLLFKKLLEENQLAVKYVPAEKLIFLDKNREPDLPYIKEKLKNITANLHPKEILLTEGYICSNSEKKLDNLQRGGSDYTASIIAAAIAAEELQIWTDVNGFQNCDPRYVVSTQSISRLSFDEAAELAYFGAKILHPYCILPCKKANIPVLLKNSLRPTEKGTIITAITDNTDIKAVAARDGISVIKIKSARMLMAYGFLKRIFEIFEKYETAIDAIATSEVAVSLTIDKQDYLEEILKELQQIGEIEVCSQQSIICVVGNMIAEKKAIVKKIFDAMKEIPIRMISYGGSKYNITMVIDEKNKKQALNSLHQELFHFNTNKSHVSCQ